MKPTLSIRLKRQRNAFGDGWKLGPPVASRVNADTFATAPFAHADHVKLFLVHVACWLLIAASLGVSMHLEGVL